MTVAYYGVVLTDLNGDYLDDVASCLNPVVEDLLEEDDLSENPPHGLCVIDNSTDKKILVFGFKMTQEEQSLIFDASFLGSAIQRYSLLLDSTHPSLRQMLGLMETQPEPITVSG